MTAEILARSLASCHCGQTKEFIFFATRQKARADNLTTCYRKKQIDISFSRVCPVIDNEFRHNIVQEAADTSNPVEAHTERTFPSACLGEARD